MGEVVIKVDNVRKTYRDYRSNLQKMRHMLLLSNAGDKNQVLRNVSFEIERGEKVAIISKPGDGKTTVMRLLAGIIKPEKGTVELKAEPYPIYDFKSGFDRLLPGRDNYEMLCTLLGWTKEEIKEREEKVFKYADLLEVIDQPLISYKGAGANRLGFAIYLYCKPEILLLDERLSFGSKKYYAKYMRRLKKKVSNPDVTFVMAANDFKTPRELCTRGIVLNDSTVAFDGPFEEAVEYYKNIVKADGMPDKGTHHETDEAADISPQQDESDIADTSYTDTVSGQDF